jgi:WD40 repeat protein
VKLWRPGDGLLLKTFSGLDVNASTLVFTPDGTKLITGEGGGTVKARSMPEGRVLWASTNAFPYINGMAVLPNSTLVAVAGGSAGHPWSGDGAVALLNAADGSLFRQLTNHEPSPAKSISCSPDGSLVAAAFADNNIVLWRISDGQVERSWHANDYGESKVISFSPDGQTLVTGGGSGLAYLKLWRVSDGQLLWTKTAYTNDIECAVFMPGGNFIATSGRRYGGTSDPLIKIWQASDGTLVRTAQTNDYAAYSISISPDGNLMASGGDASNYSGQGVMRLWNASDLSLAHTLSEQAGGVSGMAFSSEGSILASAAMNGSITLRQTSGGQHIRTIGSGFWHPRGLIFSSNDLQLLAYDYRGNVGTLYCWQVSDGQQAWMQNIYPWQALCLAAAPSADLFATGECMYGPPIRVAVRRISDGQLVQPLIDHTNLIFSLAFSPDGAWLASGSLDETIKLWQLPGSNLVRTIHTGSPVNAVAFSSDGLLLAGGCSNGLVKIWRPADGSLVRTFSGHAQSILRLAFSPDGESLVSAGCDETLRIWRLRDGALLKTYDAEVLQPISLAIAPKERVFAYGRQDATLALAHFPALMEPGSWNPSEGMQFKFYGTGGESYTIQSSTNLRDWNDWSSVVPSNTCITILDPAGGPGPKFYRVKKL